MFFLVSKSVEPSRIFGSVSQTLFYLPFEGLKRETRQEMQRGTLENPHQQSATTLSLDRLLKNVYYVFTGK
jgi:hypothetical protein